MSFSRQKGEFDRFFNRLDRPVEESRPDRQPDRPVEESRPDRQPDRPVDPTCAGRPDRCRSTQPVSISASDFIPKTRIKGVNFSQA